ncbi:MAG: DUF2975 domain-containing protein [Pseudomonadota bacterium]
MRAIGKGSLASILAMGLHVMRVVIWIAFVGLSIAVVMIPFAAVIVGLLSGVDGVNVDASVSIDGGDYLEIAYYFVTAAVLLFIINHLLEILKTLRFGSPFVMENADRFRAIGYALLIGELAKFAFGFLSIFIEADVDVGLELITWIAIIAVFVLSEVFREGARMKQEQELTI